MKDRNERFSNAVGGHAPAQAGKGRLTEESLNRSSEDVDIIDEDSYAIAALLRAVKSYPGGFEDHIILRESIAITYDGTGHDMLQVRFSTLPDEWHNRPA